MKSLHDALRGLRTELDLRNDSAWGRQLTSIRADISNSLQSEIESVPGRVRRILRQRADGETYDFIHDLIHHEYSTYPVARHDDMLDCAANLMHPDVAPSLRFPVAPGKEPAKPGETGQRHRTRSEWKPRGW